MSGDGAFGGESVPFPLADDVQERLRSGGDVVHRGYTPGPLDSDFPFSPPPHLGEVAAGDVMDLLAVGRIRSGVNRLLLGGEK